MTIEFSKEMRKHIAAIITEGPEEETAEVLRRALALYVKCRNSVRDGGKVYFSDGPNSELREINFDD